MSQDIKFRARFIEDNQWRYFALVDITRLGSAFVNYRDWSQFTGLRDKNGKEIYEGDVVVSADGNPFVVQWRGYFWEISDAKRDRHAGLGVHDAVEIIGNIYENPELLTNPR